MKKLLYFNYSTDRSNEFVNFNYICTIDLLWNRTKSASNVKGVTSLGTA